jgi:hypothetical protein
MENQLNEAFKISKGKTPNSKNIAFFDPKLPENKDQFKYMSTILNKYGGKYDKRVGPFLFWYIGETEEQHKKIFNMFIKPCLQELNKQIGTTQEENDQSLVDSLSALISEITTATTSPSLSPDYATSEEKENVLDRLDKYKQMIVNLDSDEEFKKIMMSIATFKNAQGHRLSPMNALLVWLQNSKASMVKSAGNWGYLNRVVKPDAKRLLIYRPSAQIPYTKEEKAAITANFLKFKNVKSVDDLITGDKEILRIRLRGRFNNRFDLAINYDISDTSVMEGKEDLVKADEYHAIKWSEEEIEDENVRPIYSALLEFAKQYGISVEQVADMGDAKGSSAGGKIKILPNKGNDVGLTKTLAHEVMHEILHQSYLKSKDNQFVDYFLGKEQGRKLVEQQAELSAWMILAEYGYNLQTTSLNYVALWGADKNGMIFVFDIIQRAVNKMLAYIDNYIASNKQTADTNIAEDAPIGINHHITSMDIAKVLGVESEYQQILHNQTKTNALNEKFYKLVNKR